jgi:glycine cleavage system H protein
MIDEKTLRYTTTHEWVHLDGEIATVGISRFAVDQLTDLLHIDLAKVGKVLDVGGSFGEIESVKSVNDLYTPVAGEVVEVNQAVAKDVQVLGEDPYNKGWLVKLRVSDPSSALPGTLMDYDAYQKQIADGGH